MKKEINKKVPLIKIRIKKFKLGLTKKLTRNRSLLETRLEAEDFIQDLNQV